MFGFVLCRGYEKKKGRGIKTRSFQNGVLLVMVLEFPLQKAAINSQPSNMLECFYLTCLFFLSKLANIFY